MRKNSTILVTGGTGSFGQKFVEIALKELDPKEIRVFSRGELLQKEMSERFSDPRIIFYIGDVRDKEAVRKVVQGCDLVVHAAALKHIPIAEENPSETIKTNIGGSFNVIMSAIEAEVEKVIAISSDKAVKPVNLYGATKMCMEKLIIQANMHQSKTSLSCVRYGNVVGSRGSLIYYLIQNPKRVLLTDERMTRFWLTLEQGVQFVLKSIDRMVGGEIFIPNPPSMKVRSLIETLCLNTEIYVTGIRPGEKLNEELISIEESTHSFRFEDGTYMIIPEIATGRTYIRNVEHEKEFSYNSGENEKWLTPDEMMNLSRHLT